MSNNEWKGLDAMMKILKNEETFKALVPRLRENLYDE